MANRLLTLAKVRESCARFAIERVGQHVASKSVRSLVLGISGRIGRGGRRGSGACIRTGCRARLPQDRKPRDANGPDQAARQK
jgi:hypothetical protein